MARLIRKKCAHNLIEAKVVVKASGAQVKAAKVVVKVAPVPVVVKTHADPAKVIEISLVLNAVTPKAY